MRPFDLPTGQTVDLDEISGIGTLHINKNYPEYNCYEVYIKGGDSVGIFENDVPRATLMALWKGEVTA